MSAACWLRRMPLRLLSAVALLGWIVAGKPVYAAPAAAVRYVDLDAGGANNGTSWADAYTSLQDALAAAQSGDEIWVAAGRYIPGTTGSASFQLKSGVAVYGGFAGGETQRTQRDWAANVTVLSGDLYGDDTTDDDGVVVNPSGIIGLNATHVVNASGVDATARLDGFVLTGGWATLSTSQCPDGCGGGLFAQDGSPMLANLLVQGNRAYYGAGMFFRGNSTPMLNQTTFRQNWSYGNGGGMQVQEGAQLMLTDVTFVDNKAESKGGGALLYKATVTIQDAHFSGNAAVKEGGGLYSWESTLAVRRTLLHQNRAERGGGMFNESSAINLVSVTFTGNRASVYGGGLYSHDAAASNLALTNVVFAGNRAASDGGAIFCDFSDAILTNVTMSGNYANNGGGMYNSAGSDTVVRNGIFWANSPNSNVSGFMVLVKVRNTLIEGGVKVGEMVDEGGNLNVDPLFVRAVDCGADGCTDDPNTTADESANDDYGDLRLVWNSPAVDAGSNSLLPADTLDLDGDNDTAEPLPLDRLGEPRVVPSPDLPATVDMGAYEWFNLAPTAHAGGPYAADEGDEVALDGGLSHDDIHIDTYAWDCTDDGSIDATTTEYSGAKCVYPDDGQYTLRLTVTDSFGVTGTATATVTIANVAPVYTSPPNQSTAATSAKSFVLGSFTDPGSEDSWSITVDWGDDTAQTKFEVAQSGALPTRTHAYAAPGTYNVVVSVDDGGATDSDGFQVVVNPAPPGAPQITKPGDQSTTVGNENLFSLGSFVDPDSFGPWGVSVDWGDGTVPTQFSVTASGNLADRAHRYTNKGTFNVLVTVNDGSVSGSAIFLVAVGEDVGGSETRKLYFPALRRR